LSQSAAGSEFWIPPRLAWSPNGEFLAVVDKGSPQDPESIFLLSIRGDQKRKLTTPPAQSGSDLAPAFSPDGRTLAFIRVRTGGYGPCGIYLLSLSADGTPAGEPRRLLSEEWMIHGLDWTADGRSIVFSAVGPGISPILWRIPVSGGKPQRLDVGGDARYPAASREGDRLVYARKVIEVNIWRTTRPASTDLASTGEGGSPEGFIHSTGYDLNPKYSPDGERIAFVSSRSGIGEIYICDSDGSNQQRLTSFGEARRRFRDHRSGGSGEPRWSPDGRLIAFQSCMKGDRDIYVVSAEEGTAPRRLTREASQDVSPSWSKDGKWIYFGSDRTGDWQIWRMPSEGGPAEQVTKNGGYEAFESADGRFVYYAKRWPTPGIWKVPVAGGEETQVLDDGTDTYWELLKEGICYIPGVPRGEHTIKFFRFATGRLEHVGEAPGGWRLHKGFAASPDGRWILYPHVDEYESDIMLVENFR
jgi:Tol biopolymer transport system component